MKRIEIDERYFFDGTTMSPQLKWTIIGAVGNILLVLLNSVNTWINIFCK
jgi:hypothetical protein